VRKKPIASEHAIPGMIDLERPKKVQLKAKPLLFATLFVALQTLRPIAQNCSLLARPQERNGVIFFIRRFEIFYPDMAE
jgi:hypothetical protein